MYVSEIVIYALHAKSLNLLHKSVSVLSSCRYCRTHMQGIVIFIV